MLHALHGQAGQPGDLEPLLAAAGSPHTCLHLWAFLRGHPRAGTLTGFAAAFQSEVDRRAGPAPRVLLGYSLGARLALHVLLHAPEKWDAAILLSPHPGLATAAEREARLRADQSWAARFSRDPWPEVMHAWNAQPVLAAGSAPADPAPLESWRPEIARACDGWSLARQEDLRAQLSAITCPVLWITGARDEKFTALAAAACPLLPRGHHAMIPAAGHRTHLDQPAAVAREMSRFLCPGNG